MKTNIQTATGKQIIERLNKGYSIILGMGLLHAYGPTFRMIVIENGYKERKVSEVRSITVCPTLSRDELIGYFDSSKENIISFLRRNMGMYVTDLPTIIDTGCVVQDFQISMLFIDLLTGYDNGVSKLALLKEYDHKPIDRLLKEMDDPLYKTVKSDHSGHLTKQQAADYYNHCFYNFEDEVTAYLALVNNIEKQNLEMMAKPLEIIEMITACGPGRFAKFIVNGMKNK